MLRILSQRYKKYASECYAGNLQYGFNITIEMSSIKKCFALNFKS